MPTGAGIGEAAMPTPAPRMKAAMATGFAEKAVHPEVEQGGVHGLELPGAGGAPSPIRRRGQDQLRRWRRNTAVLRVGLHGLFLNGCGWGQRGDFGGWRTFGGGSRRYRAFAAGKWRRTFVGVGAPGVRAHRGSQGG